MLEIIRREGAVGDVWFTPAPSTDIEQIGDPWDDAGIFSAYDTDLSFSDYLNGTVDDDGNYLPVSVVYSGPLSSFPVESSLDAAGTWDVSLSTSSGNSDWEAVETLLRHGTITIAD